MNVIVLGKLYDNAFCVIEREDNGGLWWAVKYGDWNGGQVDWYVYDSRSDQFERHSFSDPYLFSLVNYPLVPVEYDGQYALVVLANQYELFADERLVKVGPASPQLIKKTLQDMWS